jgi:hypothetical protein
MIYKSQYNALLPEPEVKEPDEDDSKYYGFIHLLNTAVKTFKKGEYDKDVEAYNNWLSSQIPVVGEHKWKDLQEVVEGEDYDVRWPDPYIPETEEELREAINEMWAELPNTGPVKKVAIPKKEKEDLEPEASNTDEASVASHSGTVGNSIEHWAKDIEEQADNDYAMMQACEFAEWMNKNVVDYLLDANKFRHEGLEYTAQELYEGPFLHSQWERK